MTPRLLPISEAAALLDVPEKSLLREAEKHGHLVRMGRALRILESELGELIDKCRSQPKAQDCSSENAPDAPPSMSSKIVASQSAARAQRTADKLKKLSRNTSRAKSAKVVPLRRQK